MKKAISVLAFIFAAAVAMAIFVACASTTSETQDVWLQRYEERPIEVSKGTAADYEWTSSDESVVTVENGKLIAQSTSRETVTVTGKSSSHTVIINVRRVNDTAGKPEILIEDFTVYIGIETQMEPQISYNGSIVDTSAYTLTYTATAGDPAFLSADGLKVTGLQEGETDIILQTQYKGLTISGMAKVTVKPATYVEAMQEEYKLIFTDNEKVNSAVLQTEAFVDGKAVDASEVSYRVIEGDAACVSFEGNTVTAKKVGSVTVEAYLTDDAQIKDTFTVEVAPPYEEETFEIADMTRGVSYAPYEGEVGGRSGVMRYLSGKLSQTPEGWNDIWPHRIVNSKTGANLVEAYRSGYRYFTYDIYLSGPSQLLVGFTNGGTTFNIPYDTFFYSSWVKILDEDGNVVNRVVEKQWLTIVYDLYAFILEYPSATLSFFYTSHVENMEVFLTNIYYRYDDTFMQDDGVAYSSQEGYVQASNNEFHSFANADNSVYAPAGKEVDGVEGSFKLTGRSDDYLQNTMVAISSLGTTRGDALTRLSERGRYLTFDLYIENASGIYFALLSQEVEFRATVDVTDFSDSGWISVIRDGKLRYTLEEGCWQTICIDYEELCLSGDMMANTPVAIEFALMNAGDVAYVNNVRYYQTDSFMPDEYAGVVPSGMAVSDPEKATLTDITEGEFADSALYTNLSGGEIVFREVQNGTTPGIFFSEGRRFIAFEFYLNEGVTSFTMYSLVQRAEGDVSHDIENGGTVTVGEKYVSDGNLYIYDYNGNVVDTVQTGEWYVLSFYVEYMDEPDSAQVGFRINGDGQVSAYLRGLALTDQPVYGEELPAAEFVPGWINTSGAEVSIIPVRSGEFAGTDRYINWTQGDYSGASFSSIQDGSFYADGWKYLSYDFYLTQDVTNITVFSWITSPTVKDTAFSQTISVGSLFTHTDRIYFFDANGEPVHRLQAGAWYTVTIEMNYPAAPDWSLFYFRTGGTDGSVSYLKNFKASNTMPYEWEPFSPVEAQPLGFIAGSGATVTDDTKDGVAVKKVEADAEGQVLFAEVIGADGTKGEFFASGWKYVTFDMYVESSGNFLFNTSTHNIWTNANGFDWSNVACGVGEKQGNYLRSYSEEGIFEPLTMGKWYTVSMRVEDYSSDASIQASGGAAVFYLKNLRFSNTFPETKEGGIVTVSPAVLLNSGTDGEFAGSVQVSAVGGGDEWANTFTFDGLAEAVQEGKTTVSFEMYFETGSALSFAGNGSSVWWSSFGHAANPVDFSGVMQVKDAGGSAVTTLTSVSQHGSSQWYSITITIGEAAAVSVGIGNGGVAYVRNVVFG